MPPIGTVCRVDCTFCGDGITQIVDGESCDDGNNLSGCRPDKPQKPIDACLNSCLRPLCDDPAKIQLYDEVETGKKDVVALHGRLISDVLMEFDGPPFGIVISKQLCSHDAAAACTSNSDCEALSPGSFCTDRVCAHDGTTPCQLEATCDALQAYSTCTSVNPASIVFSQTLANGVPHGTPLRWRYRDFAAKTNGGIGVVKIQGKMDPKRCAGGPNADQKCQANFDCPSSSCVGYYIFKLQAYGPADFAAKDMQTRIYQGNERWAVRGLWQSYPHSWKLDKKSIFLEPWPLP
jgi:hypothetical protein